MRRVDEALLETLAPMPRLALAYAPARARPAWLAFLALDARLGQLLRAGREPILTQIRLAWWRDRLREPAGDWPRGEPLLAALTSWHGRHRALEALVDGWEGLLGEGPLDVAALEGFAAGRAGAVAALALALDCAGQPAVLDGTGEPARGVAAGWALADLAAHLTDPAERAAAMRLAGRHDRRSPRLPRSLRPLIVLHGLAWRGADGGAGGGGAVLLALRLGLLGF